MIIPKNAFVSLSVMTVADLLHLPPVRGKLIFSQFSDKDSMKYLLGLQLWHLFKHAKLTVVVRQNDKLFIDLLINRVRVGNIDDDAEKLLKARFIRKSDEKYPKDVFHMYAKSNSAMKRYAVLNDLPAEFNRRKANDKIPDSCKYPLATIPAVQNQKQTNIGGLAKLLKIKIDANVMLTVNLDIQDRLMNGQTGNTKNIEFVQGSI